MKYTAKIGTASTVVIILESTDFDQLVSALKDLCPKLGLAGAFIIQDKPQMATYYNAARLHGGDNMDKEGLKLIKDMIESVDVIVNEGDEVTLDYHTTLAGITADLTGAGEQPHAVIYNLPWLRPSCRRLGEDHSVTWDELLSTLPLRTSTSP